MRKKTAVQIALQEMNEPPEEAARSLREFHQAACALSSDQQLLIDAYPDRWVATSDGTVVAHGDELEQILRQVDEQGLARSDVIVRFIERTQRTLIL